MLEIEGFDRCPWPSFYTSADERAKWRDGRLFHAIERGGAQELVRLGNFVDRLLCDVDCLERIVRASQETRHGEG